MSDAGDVIRRSARYSQDFIILFERKSFTGQTDESFNIKCVTLIGCESFDAAGFKNDDLTTLRRTKVIAHAVHEEMIAGFNSHADDFVAFVISLAVAAAGLNSKWSYPSRAA